MQMAREQVAEAQKPGGSMAGILPKARWAFA